MSAIIRVLCGVFDESPIHRRRCPNRLNVKLDFTSEREAKPKTKRTKKGVKLLPAHRHDGSRPDQGLQSGRCHRLHSVERLRLKVAAKVHKRIKTFCGID